MKLTKAGQAEILRAAQRDEIFKEQLGNDASELLQLWCGVGTWIKYKDTVKMASRILYDVTTTMFNLQTLGEEFTGLVQVNRSATALPHKYLQVLMILVTNCGKKVFLDIVRRCKKKFKNIPKDHSFQEASKLVKMLSILEVVIPLLEKTHRALFYFNGAYYEVAKRLFGIRYVLVRYWLKDRISLPAFRLLGFISVAYLIAHSVVATLNFKNEESEIEQLSITENKNMPATTHKKCPLCLNVLQNTSATPCGHLFCWSCIISWLQEQPKCPICRRSAIPSRVVYLRNYSVLS